MVKKNTYDKFEKYSELYSTNKGSKTIFMILIIILIGLGFYFTKIKNNEFSLFFPFKIYA